MVFTPGKKPLGKGIPKITLGKLSLGMPFWICTTLVVISKLKYPPNRGTYHCWADIKNAFEYHLVNIPVLGGYQKCLLSIIWLLSSHSYLKLSGYHFSMIPWLNPLITSSNLYEKNQMNENWIQKKQI